MALLECCNNEKMDGLVAGTHAAREKVGFALLFAIFASLFCHFCLSLVIFALCLEAIQAQVAQAAMREEFQAAMSVQSELISAAEAKAKLADELTAAKVCLSVFSVFWGCLFCLCSAF